MSANAEHADALIDRAFERMVEHGLMERVPGGYRITEKGRRYLQEHEAAE